MGQSERLMTLSKFVLEFSRRLFQMIFRLLVIAVPFIWFGLVCGISFIEAPLKFQAPGISLELGLGIGRLVFGVLNKIEIALAIVLVFSFLKVRPAGYFPKVVLGVILAILLLETVWLLPRLDIRAQAVIDGTASPYSNMHVIYIVFDTIKLVLLVALGVDATRKNLNPV